MKEKIKLSGVPETMLQTVYARAKESSGRGAIHDAKAEELIEKLDYDFSLADKDTAMRSGVIARTIVLDQLTKSWLAAHSGAVVVNIACGLDTRCYRMPGYAHWPFVIGHLPFARAVFSDGEGNYFMAHQGRLSPQNQLMVLHIRQLFFTPEGLSLIHIL